MIIKELHLHSFGKLKDMKITLSDNLNVIYGPNESGKSTISAFVEAMLYSYPPRDSLRKKYFPWDGAPPSGSITLTHNGKDFTIYKTFGATPKGDDVTVTPPFDYESIFPRDRETYRKSVYCSENSALYFGHTAEMDTLIQNIVKSGDESVNASSAISKLEKLRKTLKPQKGTGGKLNELEKKISQAETRLFTFLEKEKQNSEIKAKISEKESYMSRLLKEREGMKSASSSETKFHLEEIEKEISRQKEYVSAFPKETIPAFSPPRFLSPLFYTSLIISFLIFILFFNKFPLVFTSVSPLFFYGIYYIIRKHSLLSDYNKTLENMGFKTYFEYLKMCSDKEKAITHLSDLIDKKSLFLEKSPSESQGGLNKVNEELLILKDEIFALKSTVSIADCTKEDIEKELEYLKTEREDIIKRIKAIDLAIEAIEYAKDTIATDFSPQITQKSMEYLSHIAPKEGRSVSVSKDLDLLVTDPVPRDISSYSRGFQDEVYLCLRLALSDYLFSNTLPIILDTPFSTFDFERETRFISLLSDISASRQVIVFTNRKNPNFTSLGCNWVDISCQNVV